MNQNRAKKIRKQIAALKLKDPEKENRIYKHLKKLTNSNPVKNPKLIMLSKRHRNESLEDFQLRRKICNAKRRLREKKT